jgi:hypothetical protein
MAVLAYEESDDPAGELLALGGLKIEHLYDAIRTGEADRRTCTKDDPTAAPGTKDYYGRVRGLRETLRAELQWMRFNLRGLALVVSPDKTIAIGVTRGDANTGIRGARHPRSHRPLGQLKRDLVQANAMPTLFDLPGDPANLDDEEIQRLDTWLLVTNRVWVAGKVTVYCELSRPVELDGAGHVIRYSKRIILPPLEFEGVVEYIPDTDDGPDAYDVPVEDH